MGRVEQGNAGEGEDWKTKFGTAEQVQRRYGLPRNTPLLRKAREYGVELGKPVMAASVVIDVFNAGVVHLNNHWDRYVSGRIQRITRRRHWSSEEAQGVAEEIRKVLEQTQIVESPPEELLDR